MSVIIQDTWNNPEDVDLLEYLSAQSIPHKFLYRDSISDLKTSDILIPFFDRDLIQQILTNENNTFSVKPYPDELKHFYHRDITMEKYRTASFVPYFLKPTSYDKSQSAKIVSTLQQHCELGNVTAYRCEIVTFVNEYRMFVANGLMAGLVDASQYIFGSAGKIQPPHHFLQAILACNKYKYCVIDVGLLSDGTWCIVGVNPPFAVFSYEFPIKEYIQYCKQAWEYIITINK